MRTTIRKLIEVSGLQPEDTVYAGAENAVLDFELTAGDFFVPLCGVERGKNYSEIYRYYKRQERLREETGVPRLREQIEALNRKAVYIKKTEKGEARKEKLLALSEEKRALRSRAAELELAADQRARESWEDHGGRGPEELQFFEYKNRALVTTFSDVCAVIPELEREELKELYGLPLLVSSLTGIRDALDSGEPLGFVGGPCLFGADEVLVRIGIRDGEIRDFDCSCGRSCTRDKEQPVITLEAYLSEHQGQVQSVQILNRKAGITRQEYISLSYLFAAADALGAKVVVPLPDLSYIKYMESDVASLDPELRRAVMEEFREEAFNITDIYLEVIELLKRKYPALTVIVLHEREREILERFYEKRAPYLSGASFMKKLTNVGGKKDAVVDYITMLALPYYLYGIRHIVQFDSLDETDSGRKCQKLHGSHIVLDSILYPELISGDGENTIYNTDLQHKDYLRREEYGQ